MKCLLSGDACEVVSSPTVCGDRNCSARFSVTCKEHSRRKTGKGPNEGIRSFKMEPAYKYVLFSQMFHKKECINKIHQCAFQEIAKSLIKAFGLASVLLEPYSWRPVGSQCCTLTNNKQDCRSTSVWEFRFTVSWFPVQFLDVLSGNACVPVTSSHTVTSHSHFAYGVKNLVSWF